MKRFLFPFIVDIHDLIMNFIRTVKPTSEFIQYAFGDFSENLEINRRQFLFLFFISSLSGLSFLTDLKNDFDLPLSLGSFF